ncbi:MAG TPA: ABC transporter permease [Candidatus Polarisedimenticolia bacterium]|nr:ABC transporter permease [Candidatus Polarisedimenticolia bacterium]
MLAYVARRAGVSALMLLGVATLTFLLVHAAPGDPADLYTAREMDPAARAAVLASFGLDRPLPEQYLRWLAGLARGDLGWSFTHRRPVIEVLGERLAATMLLALPAFAITMALGAALGLVSAWRPGSAVDAAASAASLLLSSVPLFWLGSMLILAFSVRLGWFPSSGMRELIAPPGTLLGTIGDRLSHLALPAACLALGSAAATARFVRAGLLESLASPYAAAARARGAGERQVLLRHGLRNALLPLVTLAGLSVPFLLGGSVLVETVFSWPGMGGLSVEAIFARDYPVAMAVQLMLGALVVAGNLAADLGSALADPRLRDGWRP